MPLFLIKYKTLNPYLGHYLKSSNNVLGLSSFSGNYIDPKVYEKDTDDIPFTAINTPTPTKKPTNKNKSNKSGSTVVTTINPTPNTNLQKLVYKTDLILNYIKTEEAQKSISLSSIFEEQLVNTFGEEELKKIFIGVTDISFLNPIINQNEGLVSALVTKNGVIQNYYCYFLYKNNDWYLYKTELK